MFRAGGLPTARLALAKIVPLSCARLGELAAVIVIVRQAGGPGARVTWLTGCHAPWPPFAVGFHHWAVVPPWRSQSRIVTLVNWFGSEMRTSKKEPAAENVGGPAGFAG